MTVNLDQRIDLNMFGTTLRSWDPTIQAWRIAWTNPVVGHREDQIGRRSGKDIVQMGTRADGTQTRWTFTAITPTRSIGSANRWSQTVLSGSSKVSFERSGGHNEHDDD